MNVFTKTLPALSENSFIFVKNKYDSFVIKQQLFMQKKVNSFHKKGW